MPSTTSTGTVRAGLLFEGVNPFDSVAPLTPDPSFSLPPAAADAIAAALKGTPTARITICENARRKGFALVAQIHAAASAAPVAPPARTLPARVGDGASP